MYPYLMDSDHVSLIDRAGVKGERIISRIAVLPPNSIAVSLISYEEQMRGWMAQIARMPSVDQQMAAYARLDRMRDYYCTTPVLPFDEKTLAQFQSLWLRRLRVGTMDLKIAATALANKATLNHAQHGGLRQNSRPAHRGLDSLTHGLGRPSAATSGGVRGKTVTPRELQWQKMQAREKDTLAIIRRDFSASRMNTTKWQEVAECLSGLSVQCRFKYVDVERVLEMGSFWHVTRDWFDGGPHGPFTSISVEWLDIDPHQKMERGLLLKPTSINHADELERRLQAVQVPYYWEINSIRIVGHVHIESG